MTLTKSLLAVAALLVAGCSGFIEKRAADTTFAVLQKTQIAAKRQPDLELARAAVPGGVLQLEAFALAYPSHRGFRVMHAEALCQYATAFVFDDWEDASLTKNPDVVRLGKRVEGLVSQCIDANLALLAPAWRSARTSGAWIEQLRTATVSDTDALRWIATSDAVLLALAPFARIATLPIIDATLSRVIELAPGAHESDAELMLGTLQAGRSQFLGGDDGSALFDKARKHLGASSLLVEVMYARAVAVARKDRALLTSVLERVLAADVTAWPDKRLANELARLKAARYLAALDVLIPPA
jgi:hypothetical protein